MFRRLTIIVLLLAIGLVGIAIVQSTGNSQVFGRSATAPGDPASLPGGPGSASNELPSRSGSFSVLAIGDSLMVGARDELADAHDGIVLDAERGRKFSTGIDVLEEHLATSTPDVVVFALGTNNGATPEQIAEVMDLASDVEEVIFVNVVVPRGWQEGTNVAIVQAAALHDNVSIVDWYAESFGIDELFRSDGYHLSPTGTERWVALIIDATRT